MHNLMVIISRMQHNQAGYGLALFIDDLWKLDQPVGEGVYGKTPGKSGHPSCPFLMTGYDKKTISLTAVKDAANDHTGGQYRPDGLAYL